MQSIKLDRRDMFKGLLAISAAGALASCGGAQESGDIDVSVGDDAPVAGFFSASQMAVISALADTIIPQTETGGAVAAGVPETLQALATDWGDVGFKSYWSAGLAKLGDTLNERGGSAFETLSAGDRVATLGGYDAEVFDGETEDGFYRDIKSTIVQAYYMSEIGAAEELAYEPVPGEWIGCVPLSDFPKTWAT